ncbi:FAD-NAD(P)-binding protein [Algoriphagus yeomjeoni]|uniref:FAD-NAD(P)-binding protein n=2 Tax=Algoriphagus yeomjeoni TaxID=291403 RepID=A0A327PW18_9BACT|nr:FAD-NAD(P)-binding protein [Algoriphagus yeomjeoni]
MRIAIVGLGPKGLYGLERLLANLAEAEYPFPTEIHLFNKSDSFGAGEIYNPAQPSYLKMNYVNGYINMWPEQKPKPNVPHPKSFVEWLNERKDEFPNDSEYTFSSRATVGRYLSEGFNELLENCPEHISIFKHVGDVIGIEQNEDGYSVDCKVSDDNVPLRVNAIQNLLIATGHPCINDADLVAQDTHIDFIYPVDLRLKGISSGSKVAIKGMGLTFIDAVLALTEGRGGKFVADETGDLIYTKSGMEPEVLYPFSKSGMLMIPRGNTYGKSSLAPFYFNKESVEYSETLEGKYDFEHQLLPLIEQDFTVVYYSKLFSSKGLKLEVLKDYAEVEFQIENFHEQNPDLPRFDFYSFLEGTISDGELNKSTLEFIRMSIQEAERGVEESAFAAAADAWRHLSDLFNELYSFGGLKPQSQKTFLEKYAGHLNRISYGPPIENMKKIEAIAKAGLIDFSFSQNPEISYSSKTILSNNKEEKVSVDFLVDARVPKIQLHRCAGPLYSTLLEQNLIIPYVNRLEGRLDFRPGCLAINEKGNPLDETGWANETITFTGTPTEGLTYDNDSLSRQRNDFVSDWAKDLTKKILQEEPETQLRSNSI